MCAASTQGDGAGSNRRSPVPGQACTRRHNPEEQRRRVHRSENVTSHNRLTWAKTKLFKKF